MNIPIQTGKFIPFSMPPFVLIPLLFILFAWIFYRWTQKQSLGLSWQQVFLAFGLKVLLGIAYGYIFYTQYHGDDTWYFNSLVSEEHLKLINDPRQFFLDFSPLPAFRRNPTLSEGWYFYLTELELALLTKPLALFHSITGGNYYNNTILYNFISFWPMLWLYRTYKKEFPEKKKALYITLFLVPSLLFWLSGIRSDGYLMLFLVLLLVNFHQWVEKGNRYTLIYIFLGITGIIVFRSVLLFLLVPALTCWWITVRFRKRALPVVILVYGFSAFIFFGSSLISPNKNFPGIVVQRQQAFLQLKGNTRYDLPPLQPNLLSYSKVLPYAVNNSFFRPYIWEWKGTLQGIAAAEIAGLFLLAFLALWKNEKGAVSHFSQPLLLYPFLFALSLYVFIGYTIPFPGAIIRYKIPGEWFLVMAFITGISWQRIFIFKK